MSVRQCEKVVDREKVLWDLAGGRAGGGSPLNEIQSTRQGSWGGGQQALVQKGENFTQGGERGEKRTACSTLSRRESQALLRGTSQ